MGVGVGVDISIILQDHFSIFLEWNSRVWLFFPMNVSFDCRVQYHLNSLKNDMNELESKLSDLEVSAQSDLNVVSMTTKSSAASQNQNSVNKDVSI